MILWRRFVPAVLVVVAFLACRSGSSTEPLSPDVLIGQWGGGVTQLVADRNEVRVQSGCLIVRFPQLLVKGIGGRVFLPPTLITGRAGAPTELATIEGTVVADTMNLDLRVGGPYGASLNHVRLVRGEAVDWSNVICLA